jgi:hypothetical protein
MAYYHGKQLKPLDPGYCFFLRGGYCFLGAWLRSTAFRMTYLMFSGHACLCWILRQFLLVIRSNVYNGAIYFGHICSLCIVMSCIKSVFSFPHRENWRLLLGQRRISGHCRKHVDCGVSSPSTKWFYRHRNAACREWLLKKLHFEIKRLVVSTITFVRHVWCDLLDRRMGGSWPWFANFVVCLGIVFSNFFYMNGHCINWKIEVSKMWNCQWQHAFMQKW